MRKYGCTILVLAGLLWPGVLTAQTPDYRPLPVGEPDVPPPLSNDAFPLLPSERRVIIPPPPPPIGSSNTPTIDPNLPPAPPRGYQPVVPIPDDGLGTRPAAPTQPARAPLTSDPGTPRWGPPGTAPQTNDVRYTPQPVSQPAYTPQPVSQPSYTPAPSYQPEPAYTSTPPVIPQPEEDDFTTPPASRPEAAPAASAPQAAPVAPPAGLLVQKLGPESVNLGTPLRYEIVARNVSTAQLLNVKVEDEIPPGARLLRADPTPEIRNQRMHWNLGTLEPGAERRFLVELDPGNAGEIQSCATITASANDCLRTRITQPRLTLSKVGPETAQVGDMVPFELVLANAGTGPARNVVLHDQLPAGLQHPNGSSIDADIGTLEPGETKRIQLRTTAVKPGQHINQARVTADNAPPVTASATVFVTEPALLLRKTGPEDRFIDRDCEFDLEVSNPGNAPATNVQVFDRLPPGLEFVSTSDNGVYDPTARLVTWNLGTLAPGARRGLTLKVRGVQVGTHLNQAVARADRDLESRSQAQVRIEGVPAMMLEVVDLDDPIEVGEETTYEIRVLNQGTTGVTRVQIMATVPAGMTPRVGEGPTAYRIQGQQVIFEPLDRLAARADATYRVKVQCREPGDWRFKVQMMCDQLRQPVNEQESTRIYRD